MLNLTFLSLRSLKAIFCLLVIFFKAALSLATASDLLSSYENEKPSIITQSSLASTSPRQKRKIPEIGDYFHKTTLEADDLKAILTLLSDNLCYKSKKSTKTTMPTIIAQDDSFILKAQFNYTPENYLNKELEILSCENSYIGQGKKTLIITFRNRKGTVGREYNLTLTVEKTAQSLIHETSSGKIKLFHRSTSFNEQSLKNQLIHVKESQTDTQDMPEDHSPSCRKRSISLSDSLNRLGRAAISPLKSRKKQQEEPSSLARSRAITSPAKVKKIDSSPSKSSKSGHPKLLKSFSSPMPSSNLSQKIQAPASLKNDVKKEKKDDTHLQHKGTRNIFKRTFSFYGSKSNDLQKTSFVTRDPKKAKGKNAVTSPKNDRKPDFHVMPLPKRSVREHVEEIEERLRNQDH